MAELEDYGIQYVNPDRVTIDPPLPQGWQMSKGDDAGTPREVFDRGLDNSRDVKALIEQGYDKNNFDRLRHSNDPVEKAVGDSYNMFWGDNPIKVDKVGDGFITDGGRHRVSVAQDRGESSIPMRVHAPADDPEFAGKRKDAARYPQDRHDTQEGKKMGREGGYRPEQHNPIETKELDGANPEKKPQIEDQQRRENLHKEQGHDHAMKGGTDAPASDKHGADSKQSSEAPAHEAYRQHDSMDGGDGAKASHAEGKGDAMDGAGELSKKGADRAPKEMPEMRPKGEL